MVPKEQSKDAPGNRFVPELLREEDLGEVLTLQRAAFALEVLDKYPSYQAPLRQTLDDLRVEQSEPGADALGIRDRGRLIGAIRILPLGGRRALLARLSVAPDRTHEGLGGILMEAAIERVKSHHPDVDRIQFRADGSNRWLIGWYQTLGFSVVAPGSKESEYDWTLALDVDQAF